MSTPELEPHVLPLFGLGVVLFVVTVASGWMWRLAEMRFLRFLRERHPEYWRRKFGASSAVPISRLPITLRINALMVLRQWEQGMDVPGVISDDVVLRTSWLVVRRWMWALAVSIVCLWALGAWAIW